MYTFFSRLLDLLSPRLCAICGNRLAISEQVICTGCNFDLPRTPFGRMPYDNEMARLLWGQFTVERVSALFFYTPKSPASHVILKMKYKNQPEVGVFLGRMTARELAQKGFFDGIDMIVPVPLAPKRRRERGDNQSEEIARGVSEVTHLPVRTDIIARKSFHGSQTHLEKWERRENVADAFILNGGAAASGKHILLIDDVMTTGATIIACGRELAKAGDVHISVLTMGFTKS